MTDNICQFCGEDYFCEPMHIENDGFRISVIMDTCCEASNAQWLNSFNQERETYNGFSKLIDWTIAPLRAFYPTLTAIYRSIKHGDIWVFKPQIETGVPQSEVKDFINKHHRHLNASLGDKFRVVIRNGVGNKVIACAMMGRPVSRFLDNGKTLEITRVAVNNNLPRELTQNACSQIYAKCCKWAKENGYDSVITYTMEHEIGASLKSANFTHEYTQPKSRRKSSWDSPSRKRKDVTPNCPKKRWRRKLYEQ